tara:strand:+ start:112 stop:759 length:648 start_codon:yes stop_codon:yes gene_type:complete
MKIAHYNQAKSWLVRPDTRTPEQRAALEAKKDAAEIERKNKKRAEYGLPSIEGGKPNPLDATGKRLVKYSETYDSPVLHDPLSNSFKTENQIKNEVEQQQKHVVDTLNDFEDLPEKLVVPKKISNTQPQRLTKQVKPDTKVAAKKPFIKKPPMQQVKDMKINIAQIPMPQLDPVIYDPQLEIKKQKFLQAVEERKQNDLDNKNLGLMNFARGVKI